MESEEKDIDAKLQCPTCRNSLNMSRSIDHLEERCPVCRSEISMAVFPRFYREEPEVIDARLASDEETVCSFYPELKAENLCDACGCLMSQKASVKWGDEDLLPSLPFSTARGGEGHLICGSGKVV